MAASARYAALGPTTKLVPGTRMDALHPASHICSPNPAADMDAKYPGFVNSPLAAIRGVFDDAHCLPYTLPVNFSSARTMFASTPYSSSANIQLGPDRGFAWLALMNISTDLVSNMYSASGSSVCFKQVGINYIDDVSYFKQIRFGALYNNECSVSSVDFAAGFGCTAEYYPTVPRLNASFGFLSEYGVVSYVVPREWVSVIPSGSLWIKAPSLPPQPPPPPRQPPPPSSLLPPPSTGGAPPRPVAPPPSTSPQSPVTPVSTPSSSSSSKKGSIIGGAVAAGIVGPGTIFSILVVFFKPFLRRLMLHLGFKRAADFFAPNLEGDVAELSVRVPRGLVTFIAPPCPTSLCII